MKNLLLTMMIIFSAPTFAQSEDSKIVSMLSLSGAWNCQVVEGVVGENREFYEALSRANFQELSATQAKKYSDAVIKNLEAKSLSRAYKADLDGEKTVVVVMERNDESASHFSTKFDLVVFVAGQTLTFPLQHKKASEFKKGILEFKLDTGVSKTEAKCRVNLLPI